MLPIHIENGGNFQFFLGENTINSGCNALYQSNLLLSKSKISVLLTENLLPGFSDIYGDNFDSITMVSRAIHPSP